MSMKEEILKKLAIPKTKLFRYKPSNRLIEFLRDQQKIKKDKDNKKKT